jgi:hypothetical protein
MYVIHLIARADGTDDEDAGRFLLDFDPSYAAGRGLLTTTEDRGRAKRFPDLAAAFRYWQTRTPTGQPLAAWTVTFEDHRAGPAPAWPVA